MRSQPTKQKQDLSKMKTFSGDSKLPRLPVPDLQETCQKYLKSIKPFVESEEEYKKTVARVQDFSSGIGRELQKLLLERDKTEKNSWLETWWNNLAYLDYNGSQSINVSPSFTYDSPTHETTQTRHAAALLYGCMRFKRSLDTQTLPIDIVGGLPQDMEFYKNIFSACRIPRPGTDEYRVWPAEESQHVVVIYKDNFYTVDVVNDRGELLSYLELVEQLERIKRASQSYGLPIGIFTSELRDTWANVRDRLLEKEVNERSLSVIERAQVVVCLDENTPNSRDELANAMLHANGNSSRFWDKLQLIVFDNAESGFVQEHTAVDGFPITLMSDKIMHEYKLAQYYRHLQGDGVDFGYLKEPERLDFDVSHIGDFKILVSSARDRFLRDIRNLELNVLRFEEFGKEEIKRCKVSPDGFVQMAFQLSYYRLHGKFAATYESVNLRHFKRGRTEVGRTVCEDSVAFVLTMVDRSKSKEEKRAAFRKATVNHVKYLKECQQGKGIDRHLLGLKLVSLENGIDLHDVFKDTAFLTSSHWTLSTSNLNNLYSVVGFGPVVHDGYGLWYGLRSDMINVTLSCWRSYEANSVERFRETLKSSFRDIRKLFDPASKL